MKQSRCIVKAIAILLTLVVIIPAVGAESNYVEPAKIVIFNPWANASSQEGIDAVNDAITDLLRETINIEIEWIIVPYDGYLDVLNSMLAGGEQIDAAILDVNGHFGLQKSGGLIEPISELIDLHGSNLKVVIPEIAWSTSTDSNGEIVAIPDYNRYYSRGAIIREDWLDELGISMPETLNDLETVLEAFKVRDKNVVPAIGQCWILEGFLMAPVTGNVSPNVAWEAVLDGKVIQSGTHPKYLDFLKMYVKWLKNGWYNADFMITDDNQNEQMFLSGKAGIFFTDPHKIDSYQTIISNMDSKAKLNYIPVLSGPGGEPAIALNYGVSKMVWVNTKGKNADRVVQFFNWAVSSQSNYDLLKLGIEGKDWISVGDEWRLPENADGDPSKRSYYDLFALDYESLIRPWADAPDVTKGLDKYYGALPEVYPDLHGFTADWELIGNVNTIDVWAEMYKIALGARPIADFEVIAAEYYASGASKIYDELTRQYQLWINKD